MWGVGDGTEEPGDFGNCDRATWTSVWCMLIDVSSVLVTMQWYCGASVNCYINWDIGCQGGDFLRKSLRQAR